MGAVLGLLLMWPVGGLAQEASSAPPPAGQDVARSAEETPAQAKVEAEDGKSEEAKSKAAKSKETAVEKRPADPPATTPVKEAQPKGGIDHTPDTALQQFRTPFEVLAERAIGRASRRIRYDWRRSTIQVAAMVALPAELNSFDSLRAGWTMRTPYDGMLLEAGFSRVWVAGSPSTERLALTPYRQPGRPDRYEIDLALGYPLAEGIVTAFPAFIPATELVLSGYVHFRYLIYPAAFSDLGIKNSLRAIVSGELSDRELGNLEDARLPGMELDPGRYGLFVGLGNDLYFQSGFFVSPRLLVAVPLLAFMTESRLRFYLEGILSMGWSF